MYEKYWNLKEKPFKNTPDPRFFYYSQEHEEALARLRYCVEEGLGAALLSGVFGCGKTMVARTLQSLLSQPHYIVAFIKNPALNAKEFLKETLWQLGRKENLPDAKTDILHLMEEMLLNNSYDGKETILIVDEVHVIEDKEVLEEIRMLLNFQTESRFLLTLILIGQPEIKQKIANLKQLAQRIAVHFYLDKFDSEDTEKYVRHRLKVAGADRDIFSPETFPAIPDMKEASRAVSPRPRIPAG